MLVPSPICGTKDNIPTVSGYQWIHKLKNKKIYFALFQRWPNDNLPCGFDFYIVSFHLEVTDINWVKRQQQLLSSVKIIVLADGNSYNYSIPNVQFFPFYYWHYQLDQMQEWFGVKKKSILKYKFSAVCNRISQSKVWSTTKLLETARDSSLIVLNSWIEEKNVHNWQDTGNDTLDDLTTIFRNKYVGQILKIDDFDNATQNSQHITGNPWQPLYTDCAINFTNESFHYSGMQENDNAYTWPGPFITEKTLKCLLAGTAFIPVGQFETYATLGKLGLEFNYGFDTTWDNDSGNLSRAHSIIDLIDYLNQFDINQLVSMAKESNNYNQNYIITGQFNQNCQKQNDETVEKINLTLQ